MTSPNSTNYGSSVNLAKTLMFRPGHIWWAYTFFFLLILNIREREMLLSSSLASPKLQKDHKPSGRCCSRKVVGLSPMGPLSPSYLFLGSDATQLSRLAIHRLGSG
jgi:hypothetical protein